MARQMSGLVKRGKIWWIRKQLNGKRIQRSTGTSDPREAERYLAHLIEENRKVNLYGERIERTWDEAAARYVREEPESKVSLNREIAELKRLAPYIGALPLRAVHMGSLQPFIESRRKDKVKNRTINRALQVVRHILNLAAAEWLDMQGRPWLEHAPRIKLLKQTDRTPPYPLSWDEQERLFAELPEYLLNMCIFKVNTGCRDQEVCKLKWEYEVDVPALDTSIFVIPGPHVKNRQDRLIILNDDAKGVVEKVRGQHPEYVFTYNGRAIWQMHTPAWRSARARAGLPHLRIHDLKHTYGRRLRAAGVSFEDRQDLLGHKSHRITTHYSMAELENLLNASNLVTKARFDRNRYKIGTVDMLRKKVAPLRLVK